MGAAKQRGTFEQRQAEAYERIDKACEGVTEHLAQLDKLEKESAEKATLATTKMVTSFLAHQESQRLRRMGIRIGSGPDGQAS